MAFSYNTSFIPRGGSINLNAGNAGVAQAPQVVTMQAPTGGLPDPMVQTQAPAAQRSPNEQALLNANQNASFMRQNPPGQRPAMSNPLVDSMVGGQGEDRKQAAMQWIQSLIQSNPQFLEALLSGMGGRSSSGALLMSGGQRPRVQSGPTGTLAPAPQPMPYGGQNVPNLFNLAVPFRQQ